LKPAGLEWRSVPMPGASGPVEVSLLPSKDGFVFRAYVRFPPGWARPGPGHYAVAEEFELLEGDLAMNGEAWRAGERIVIPAGRTRVDTRTVNGCLALACFAGDPRWIPTGNT
jgi:hypothetical protein